MIKLMINKILIINSLKKMNSIFKNKMNFNFKKIKMISNLKIKIMKISINLK